MRVVGGEWGVAGRGEFSLSCLSDTNMNTMVRYDLGVGRGRESSHHIATVTIKQTQHDTWWKSHKKPWWGHECDMGPPFLPANQPHHSLVGPRCQEADLGSGNPTAGYIPKKNQWWHLKGLPVSPRAYCPAHHSS